MKSVINDKQLKSYLLGDASDELAEKIDVQIIENNDLEERLIIAEECLIEDYLEKELNDREISLFHSNFLNSEERKEQLLTIAQLKQFAKNEELVGSIDVKEVNEDPDFFRGLMNAFELHRSKIILAFVTIVLISGLVWINFFGQASLELEYARFNNTDVKKNFDENEFSNLTLVGGDRRSSDMTKELSKSSLTEKVVFNVALSTNPNKDSTFKVELIKDKKVVFTLETIEFYKLVNGAELWFYLPSTEFEKGNYQIKVTNNQNKENSHVYTFKIT